MVVFYENQEKRAKEIARAVGGEVRQGQPSEADGLCLVYAENGLALVDGNLKMRGDFASLLPRLKVNNLRGEAVVKSAKMKTPPEENVVIDATAGLGEDGFLLASMGYRVQMIEHNPVIFALLQDALSRAKEHCDLRETASRITLHFGDAVSLLSSGAVSGNIVYLDPMFPERKKSGAVKKKFQLLHRLESPCDNERALFEGALSVHPQKIIVKRPKEAPPLANHKPNYIVGNDIRYDIYV